MYNKAQKLNILFFSITMSIIFTVVMFSTTVNASNCEPYFYTGGAEMPEIYGDGVFAGSGIIGSFHMKSEGTYAVVSGYIVTTNKKIEILEYIDRDELENYIPGIRFYPAEDGNSVEGAYDGFFNPNKYIPYNGICNIKFQIKYNVAPDEFLKMGGSFG